MSHNSSRPEAAFVLVLMQSTFWAAAGVSAIPFAIAGERYMALLGAASFLLASVGVMFALSLVGRRGWSRRGTIALETMCFVGSALLLALPVGSNRGLVSLMVNILLPVTVIALLTGKKVRAAFAR